MTELGIFILSLLLVGFGGWFVYLVQKARGRKYHIVFNDNQVFTDGYKFESDLGTVMKYQRLIEKPDLEITISIADIDS